MATTVKNLIQMAYEECQIVGEGDPISGSQLTRGLKYLNDLIYMYNLQDYLPFTRTEISFDSTGATAFIFSDATDFTLPTTDKANNYSYKIISAKVPMDIENLLFKTGPIYTPIKKTGYADLQKYVVESGIMLPCWYSYERNSDYGVLFIDRSSDRTFKCVYKKLLPEYKSSDTLSEPPEYFQMYLYGLAKKIAKHNMLDTDFITIISNEESEAIDTIKSRNKTDDDITYNDNEGSNYYNILSPREWY